MTDHPRPLDGLPDVPPHVREELEALVARAVESFGDNLSAIVLFGSAAEGRLRPTSDVNLLFVLTAFTRERVDPFRETLRLAHARAAVAAMFVLVDELSAAADAFGVKFADIAQRHHVLYGDDPFDAVCVTREAKVARLRQMLLNLAIRLRERYAMTSLREEQLARVLADVAGPLRVAAGMLLELQGTPAASPKAALETLAPALGIPEAAQVMAHLSTAREQGILPPGAAADTLFRLMEITDGLRDLAEQV